MIQSVIRNHPSFIRQILDEPHVALCQTREDFPALNLRLGYDLDGSVFRHSLACHNTFQHVNLTSVWLEKKTVLDAYDFKPDAAFMP